MCVNYRTVTENQRMLGNFGVEMPPDGGWQGELWPKSRGPILRRSDAVEPRRELAVADRWGLVPWYVKSLPDFKQTTVNARDDRLLLQKSMWRDIWARSQRCIVPAEVVYEPCWETGGAVRWGCRRADGRPMGIAGLWELWHPKPAKPVSKTNGHAYGAEPPDGIEQVAPTERDDSLLTYTMLTITGASHSLMQRMHRPDDEKRMVVILDESDYDEWLYGTPEQAFQLLRQYPAELMMGEPAPLGPRKKKTTEPAVAAATPGAAAPQPDLF